MIFGKTWCDALSYSVNNGTMVLPLQVQCVPAMMYCKHSTNFNDVIVAINVITADLQLYDATIEVEFFKINVNIA